VQPGLKDTVIKQITTELADKGKNKGDARAGSLGALKALVAKFGATAECVVLPMLGAVLEALADKLKPVSMEAEKVVDAILASMSPHAVMGITPTVLAERDGKWQSNLGRAKMLKEMAEKFPKQMNRVLTSVMPVVSGLMWDTKPQVKDTAAEAMNKSARRRHAAKRAPQHNKIAHAAAPLSPLAPHFSPSSARLRV
jgi:elongation factor 3